MLQERKEFSGPKLKVARTFHGLILPDLAEQVGLSHNYLSEVESGHKRPSSQIVDALSETLGFDTLFFYEPIRDQFADDECSFRSRKTTPASQRTRVLSHGTLFASAVAYLDEQLELSPNGIPHWDDAGSIDIEELANRCRMHWGLGLDTPITNMVRLLESKGGAVVTRFSARSEKIDAFSRRGARSIVVLNSDKESASRSRFDAAHELGHLVRHWRGRPDDEKVAEKEADAFASAFLMPRAGFEREFPRLPEIRWEILVKLKARWKVSIQAMLYRARDLGLIGPALYLRAMKQLSARGWRRGEPIETEFAFEEPEFLGIAVQELAEDGITPLKIAHELRWRPPIFTRITGIEVVADIPGTPREPGKVVSLDEKRNRSLFAR